MSQLHPFSLWFNFSSTGRLFILLKKSGKILIPLGLCCLVFFIGTKTSHRAWTGDEPRYVFYSMGFSESGTFASSPDVREAVVQKIGPRGYAYKPADFLGPTGSLPTHPVFMGILLSPVTSLYAIQGGRISTLIIGILGVWGLFYLCLQRFTPLQAGLATGMGSLGIPALPYFGLFLPEIVLFSFVAASWYLLNTEDWSRKKMAGTLLLIFCIPFIHLRGSGVAAGLFMIFLLKGCRLSSPPVPPAVWWRVAWGAAFGASLLFAWFNLFVYTHIFGSVSSGRPSFSVAAMSLSLFNFRHGLLTFAPIWLLSGVGLTIGMIQRDRLSVEATLLLVFAVLPTLGPYPGECWPARFWVVAVPMLVVGLGFWLNLRHSYLEIGIFLVFVLVHIYNTFFFILDPHSLLNNRETVKSYDILLRYLNINYEFLKYEYAWDPIFPNHILFSGVCLLLIALSLPHLFMHWRMTSRENL